MRFNYSEDEDFDGQFELYEANCSRSLCGKKGQAELRILRDALLAMPKKELIHEALHDEDGGMCAIGAYAQAKGVDIKTLDPEDATDEVGQEAGMPRLVAWTVVMKNDIDFDRHTPEKRYQAMLNWVNLQILPIILDTPAQSG